MSRYLNLIGAFTILTGAASLSAQTYQVQWNDHRPIGSLFTAATAMGYSSNPRGYFNDPSINVFTPTGLSAFQQRMLNYADTSIQVLKGMNAQGMIQWDLEGAQSVQPITYVCDPRQISKVSPEMDSIADAYFKKYSDAGLKVGLCVRPQQLVLDSTGKPIAQQDLTSDADIANLLIDKIRYANQRWGITIFYVDSNGGPYSPINPAIFQTVLSAFPNVLLIPEQHDSTYFAYTAPYSDLNWAGPGQFDFVRTPDSVKALWPQAFGVINATTADLNPLFSQLVTGVKGGDILLFHGWFNDQPTNGLVQQIYAAAGPYVPPAGTLTVGIGSPTNGSTVSGTVSASATASSGATRIEFYVDGAMAGSGTGTAYSYSWDTTRTPNGAHTLMAKAYNSAGSTASASVSVTVGNVAPPTGTQSTIRINSGGSAYTDSKGQVWSADSSFAGGQQGSTSAAVANTADPKIYQTEHYGSFDYNFGVANGTYSVTLKFAEIYFTLPGRRVFNVAINGQTVLSNFDIVAQAGGAFKAIDKTFSVNVTNSTLNIHMIPLTENPTISGIEIAPPVATFTPVRVNAGGGSYTDPAGQVWSADKGFSGGGTGTTTATISNTSMPILYQSERYGAVSYQFAAPNGNYNVTLKFAEIHFNRAGKRVFNISVNGRVVETNFDVYAAAGGKNIAIDKTYPVSVSNGQIVIQLIPVVENPKISAIEIK